MIIELFIGCIFILLWDIQNLQSINLGLFKSKIKNNISIILMVLIPILVGVCFLPNPLEKLSVFSLSFVLPFYIVRRSYFYNEASQTTLLSENKNSFVLHDALGVCLWWIFLMSISSYCLKSLTNSFPDSFSQFSVLMASAIISTACTFLLVYQASLRLSDGKFLKNVSFEKKGGNFFTLGIIPIVLGLLFAYCSATLIVNRQVQPVTPLNEVLSTADSNIGILIFISLALLIAPFVEEIVFRGYFFEVVKRLRGKMAAIVIVSLIFAFLHYEQYWTDWTAIIMITILGFVLTLLRFFTDSTIASVVMHYAYNGGVTILTIILMYSANPFYFEYKINESMISLEEKIELLKLSIDKQPEYSAVYHDLAKLYVEEEIQLDQALILCEHALKIVPEEVSFLKTKALALQKLSHNEELVKFVNYVLTLDIDDSQKEEFNGLLMIE